jgi:ribosome-binding factor A
MSRRIDRINELLRHEISQLLARQIKDPRLGGVISITEVKTSGDLRSALVLLSVMGDQATKRNALEGAQSAAIFLRRELRDRLTLRHTPFLKFALDDTLDQADHLFRVMDRIQDGQMEEVSVEDDHRGTGPLAASPSGE